MPLDKSPSAPQPSPSSASHDVASDARAPKTMHDAEQLIAAHRSKLSQHPFLQGLERPGELDQVRRVVGRLAFFVLAFQDVLRLANEKTTDPQVKRIAELHASEDAGHDIWYLQDLVKLNVTLDVAWLYSAEHRLTRDVAYGQISDVLSAVDDRSRLAVVLSLEAAGAEFFGRAISFLDRTRGSADLQYFARRHQQIESEHQVFEQDAQEQLRRISVSEATWPEVVRVVNNTFAGMSRLATDLHTRFIQAS